MKLRLTIESGSLAGQEFELEQGSIVLGRGTDSHIKFDFKHDPVSLPAMLLFNQKIIASG